MEDGRHPRGRGLGHLVRRSDRRRLFAPLSFPAGLGVETIISLSPINDLNDSDERLEAVVNTRIERRVARVLADLSEEDPGLEPTDVQAVRDRASAETRLELMMGARQEIEYNHIDLLKSASQYIVKADLGDLSVTRSLTAPGPTAVDGSFCRALRDRRATLEINPGRKIAEDDKTGRGYLSLEQDVRGPLQTLLQRSDLPRVRLVGFPSAWPDEFTQWSHALGTRLGNSRGVEWVLEDGSVVEFMPDSEPAAPEVSLSSGSHATFICSGTDRSAITSTAGPRTRRHDRRSAGYHAELGHDGVDEPFPCLTCPVTPYVSFQLCQAALLSCQGSYRLVILSFMHDCPLWLPSSVVAPLLSFPV